MHALSPEARGTLSQRRFLEAASTIHSYTPSWFVGILEADFEHDLRGVDAIAYITYPSEHWIERIPIQIKSSWTGYHSYKEEHVEHGAKDVIVIVVQDDRLDEELRRILYGELRKIREQNIRFTDFFARLLAGRVSKGAEKARQRFVRAKMRHFAHHAPQRRRVAHAAEKQSWWKRVWQRLFRRR